MRLFALCLLALTAGAFAYQPRPGVADCAAPRPGVRVQPTYRPAYTPTHHDRVVEVVPVAVPVLVPAAVFQYLPALTPTTQQTSLAVASPAPVAPAVASQATATPAGPQVDVPSLVRNAVAAALRERETGISEDDPPPVGDATQDTPVKAPGVPQDASAAETERQALSLLVTHCNACHGDAKADGGVRLFRTVAGRLTFRPTLDDQPLGLDALARSIESGKMPRLRDALGNRALVPAEKQALLGWLVRR